MQSSVTSHVRLVVFRFSFAGNKVRFLIRLHFLQKGEFLTAEGRMKKKPHAQFTYVTCSLPVKTGHFICFYATSTSRRILVIALNKARKLQVTSPAGCRLTYLQFASEFTRVVIADCLVVFCAIEVIFVCDCAGIFVCDCAGIFVCVCSYFCLRLAGIFNCDSSVFA